ncbi:hypothetical protein KM176_20575 [Pseudooceanicola sp. CBS1P-1]|uniref:Uncharacterized protein n=1 Tax=Pseudooceanicola albus TaxID=2692189 RepID=A0A6L7G9Q6_9RHOB|nr:MULTISPECIES: hypothetical protein [Pseudooceanicola]MBT9386277.1 hypothetical protein [Pseudooceanicola endophyticus]MXN20327.1 hypothetical protein [Pseudooceanicola albus]
MTTPSDTLAIKRIIGARMDSDADGRLTGCRLEALTETGQVHIELSREESHRLLDLMQSARVDFG